MSQYDRNDHPLLTRRDLIKGTAGMRERGLLDAGSMTGRDLGVDAGFVERACTRLGMEVPETMRIGKVAGKVMAWETVVGDQ